MGMRNIVEQLEAEMNDKFYTVTDLSKIFGVTRQAVHYWIKANRFPNKIEVGEGGGMIVLVPVADVERVKKEEADKLVEKLDRLGFQAITA